MEPVLSNVLYEHKANCSWFIGDAERDGLAIEISFAARSRLELGWDHLNISNANGEKLVSFHGLDFGFQNYTFNLNFVVAEFTLSLIHI